MPFKSEAQRRYLWAKEPRIADAWAHGRSSVTGKPEPASRQGKRKKGGGRTMARHKGRKGHRGKRK